jgi:hypothetical protein
MPLVSRAKAAELRERQAQREQGEKQDQEYREQRDNPPQQIQQESEEDENQSAVSTVPVTRTVSPSRLNYQSDWHGPFDEPEAPPCTVESPKPYVIEPRKKSKAEIIRETDGGRHLPRSVDPYPLTYDPSLVAALAAGNSLPPPLRTGPLKPKHACPDCYAGYKAPSCTGWCRQ